MVNRYKFHSSNPRFIVQLDSAEIAAKITRDWKTDSFGGSVIRMTIDPKDSLEHIGMVKGVPRDIPDSEIFDAIQNKYSGASFSRLFKDQQPLRTLKITFKDELQL